MINDTPARSGDELRAVVEDYERLASGGRRGVCIACRQAANAAYRRAQREALCATPEQQAPPIRGGAAQAGKLPVHLWFPCEETGAPGAMPPRTFAALLAEELRNPCMDHLGPSGGVVRCGVDRVQCHGVLLAGSSSLTK